MRKVFSSHRLENAEGVAELLRAAGIEVRILNGRSYKGNRRRTFSYSDADAPESWCDPTTSIRPGRSCATPA